MKKIFVTFAVFLTMLMTSAMTVIETVNVCSAPVFADGPEASILTDCASRASDGEDGIMCLLSLALTILTYGVGILGVVGIVISGIQYTTSQGDSTKMAKAKSRIVQVIIGLIVYALIWAGLRFLVPGFQLP